MMPATGHHALRDGFSAHTVRLAWILAVAYLLVIVYASLRPFLDWRMPPEEIFHFLSAPWPRYITLQDVAVNVAAYIPLGLLLSAGFGARFGPASGAAAATLLGALLSLLMESIQMFLPIRIASNVDLLANSLGALVGAMAAPLLAPTRILGARIHAMRHRLFEEGARADVGFVVIVLWLITQFHPTAQLFGTGALRATFDLPAYFVHTPLIAFGREATVVMFNLLAIGLMLSALMHGARRPMVATGFTVGAALAAKIVTAVALLQSPAPFAWLTPGVLAGIATGWVLLLAAIHLPRPAQLAIAAACIVIATAAINLAPDNPYQSVPARLLARGPSHFLSFSGIVRALSELWPLLAIGYLAWAIGSRARDSVRNPL